MKVKYLNIFITFLLCFSFGRNYGQSCIVITEPPPISAGTPTNATLCQAVTGIAIITLNNNLTGEDSGGNWALAPASANPAGAFNAVAGTLNPNGLAAGTYVFRYSVGTMACGDSKEVMVLIQNCCPPKICLPVTVQRL
jgi:hypothetical protein